MKKISIQRGLGLKTKTVPDIECKPFEHPIDKGISEVLDKGHLK